MAEVSFLLPSPWLQASRIIVQDLHSEESTNLVLDHVFGSVRGLHCTWLVPRTRASSDSVDVSDSGKWIYLKRGIDCEGCGLISLRGHRIMLCGWVSCLVGSQEGLETKINSGRVVPRGTQISYSAAVDLVAGLGVSHLWHTKKRGSWSQPVCHLGRGLGSALEECYNKILLLSTKDINDLYPKEHNDLELDLEEDPEEDLEEDVKEDLEKDPIEIREEGPDKVHKKSPRGKVLEEGAIRTIQSNLMPQEILLDDHVLPSMVLRTIYEMPEAESRIEHLELQSNYNQHCIILAKARATHEENEVERL
ncbi:hypothetical protein M9H77_31784 [Catharanthus roseus]|uniref:Uncharacterized protein n=1 Tax=Catharanthus roseus TaxID=4058 RepID=A0ACC0A140_CATRO|nr:hypothetical protein M9H77_31784 [Catharanthus roseus]